MAKGNPNPKNQFSKTHQPKKEYRRGPTKSKLKGMALANDLNANDIGILIRNMFDKTESELKEIIEDKEQPFLIRAFCRAFFDDVQSGKLYNINTLLDRAVGKVTDKIESHVTLGDQLNNDLSVLDGLINNE